MKPVGLPVAVVPAAGLGTRLAPATWYLPKELMPLGARPMIQWSLDEIVEAGLQKAAIITSRKKPLLEEFLRHWQRGRPLELVLVDQPEPLGLADALLRARPVTAGAPMALLLPDNVFFPRPGQRGALSQVLASFRKTRSDACGLLRVSAAAAHTYSHAGRVEVSSQTGNMRQVRRLFSKGKGGLKLGGRTFAYKTFARAVLLPHFFDYLEGFFKKDRSADEVSALQTIVRRDGLNGVLLSGHGFDAGNPAGYAAALAHWARWISRAR